MDLLLIILPSDHYSNPYAKLPTYKVEANIFSEKAAGGTLLRDVVGLVSGVVIPAPTAALVCMSSYSSKA
jgi:hypothetical protein